MGMLDFALGLLLGVVTIVLWVLRRSYQHVPAYELKRLARGGDEVAQLLYRAAAYGASLQVLLGCGVIVSVALALIFMVQALGTLGGVVAVLLLVGVGGFMFVPTSGRESNLGLAKLAAPLVARILERVQPMLSGLMRLLRRYRHISVHTGLYEKSDLVELLERQKGQTDSRIAPSEIALFRHALTFGDRFVSDVLTPKRVVKMVAANESIGPVLMDELARSGHSRFPVYDETRDNVVGILYLHDLVGARSTGVVSEVMSRKLTYVHEDFTLYQTLQAFLKTKQHLFLVVNSFEELVGIITIEDVLEQMIGRQIVDEFDHYDDLRAVAQSAAKKDHKAHVEPKPEVQATTEAPEVVQ